MSFWVTLGAAWIGGLTALLAVGLRGLRPASFSERRLWSGDDRQRALTLRRVYWLAFALLTGCTALVACTRPSAWAAAAAAVFWPVPQALTAGLLIKGLAVRYDTMASAVDRFMIHTAATAALGWFVGAAATAMLAGLYGFL